METDCSVCNIDLRDEGGYTQSGIEINLLGATPARKRVEKLFGKFKFKICHVCYLKSLGVKPLKSGSRKV